ncbi:hypothetical protein PAF17_03975 [Paracoccus sp. Z330]|uniref:Flagellar basal body-associated protein FliL n=1 Tax=Paracoccus onchidii TaxID=3017813 RepID=A0ABT4ZBJ1_9RHOB|nr:hypothetical protein [Paracoccus onchidii]MDB6176659.1 hypothetical protein [Paracoccus onchidii]
MTKFLTLLAPLIGLAAGIAAGDYLHPTAPEDHAAQSPTKHAGDTTAASTKTDSADTQKGHTEHKDTPPGWFTFPSQFFVPMMRQGDMGAMMILTLSIETDEDQLEDMKAQEHRLRDALLRQLLIHANTGGFDGNFTTEASLGTLRKALLGAARQATSLPVNAVLIADIARQAG